MSQRYNALVFIVLFISRFTSGNADEIYLPPLDIRKPNTQSGSPYRLVRNQPQLLHVNPRVSQPMQEKPVQEDKYSYNEIVEALNEIHQEGLEARAAARDPASFVQFPRPFGYTPTSYGPSPGYHTPSTTEQPTTVQPAKFPFLKPDLSSLLQPVTAKVSNKMNGLVSLIFSLLTGSAPEGLELTGFKDLLIDGILRPLLTAKSGVKSLISKLSIPVISLLLINLEVLVTVWWLWEECPAQLAPPSHPKPTYSNDNSYS